MTALSLGIGLAFATGCAHHGPATSAPLDLSAAIAKGDLTAVQSAIDAHANLEAKDAYGDTPLRQAVDANQSDIAIALLKAHANPNVKDDQGNTPLTIAYNRRSNYDEQLVLAMLDAGGDFNYTKPGNWSLIHFAITNTQSTALLQKLLEKGLDAKGSELDDSAYLIRNGKVVHDPNSIPKPGNPYIYVATANACADVVKLLLEHGADPNARTVSGAYPIFAAAYHGVGMLKPLVEHGANVNVKNEKGQSLLVMLRYQDSMGAARDIKDPEAEIEYLNAHGAKPE